MSKSDAILEARNLHKSFGEGDSAVHVLTGLDLSVKRGEFVAIMGPSGCGKSTLVHLLGLMTPPDEGEIHISGQRVDNRPSLRLKMRRLCIGFILQRFNLLPELTSADNIAISLKVRGLKMTPRVNELFETLGIAHLKDRKPSKMSIGEQQRVAVVRGLAHQPELLLADEPTGSLDSKNTNDLLEMLRTFNETRNQTIVMITHSSEAARFAQRVIRMKDGRLLD